MNSCLDFFRLKSWQFLNSCKTVCSPWRTGHHDSAASDAIVRRGPIGPTLHQGARLAFTGPYPTTFSGNTGAMVVSHTAFSGGVTNAGTIGAGGISVTSSTFLSGGFVDTGIISGAIRIDGHSTILAGGGTALAVNRHHDAWRRNQQRRHHL